MRRWITAYNKFSYALEKTSEILAGLILGVGAVMIFVEVITRYFFSKTFGILEEGPRLFLCYAILPMLGVLYKRGRHINMEILPERLKGRARGLLLVAIDVFMIAGSSILMGAGISGTKVLYQSGMRVEGVLEFPEFILMVSIPVGAGILLLFSLEAMVKDIVSLFPGP